MKQSQYIKINNVHTDSIILIGFLLLVIQSNFHGIKNQDKYTLVLFID